MTTVYLYLGTLAPGVTGLWEIIRDTPESPARVSYVDGFTDEYRAERAMVERHTRWTRLGGSADVEIIPTNGRRIFRDGRYTRWDISSPRTRAALAATPFDANGTGRCSHCGTQLWTEKHFASHFVIRDLRYGNLGYCPNVDSRSR